MRKRKPRRRPGHSRSAAARALVLLLSVAMAVVLIDHQMRPVMEAVSSHEVKVFAYRIMNDAMLRELDGETVRYDDLVRVTHNADGGVSSIQTNMATVNRLKAQVTQSIVSELEQKHNHSMLLPVGTLVGNQFTAGRGPKIEFKVLPTGYVQTEVYNQFISAGINQTLHQVMLKTSVQMTAVAPGFRVDTESVTNFCIAETVIVGHIPEAYTQINGDQAPVISKINDYTAETP